MKKWKIKQRRKESKRKQKEKREKEGRSKKGLPLKRNAEKAKELDDLRKKQEAGVIPENDVANFYFAR